MTTYAVAHSVPCSSCEYLTAGKRYEVIREATPRCFDIIDNEGDTLFCMWDGCAFLEGGNWQRIEE